MHRARPKRIRILRVITRLNVGGPALNAILLSSHLDPDEFETLLVSGTESAAEGNIVELGRIDAPPTLRRVAALGREISPLDDVRALAAVTRIARAFRPDIVHTHLAKAGTVGRLAAKAAGVRAVVHTYHGTVFRGYFGSAKSRLFLEIERALAHATSRIVAITPGQRQQLLSLGIGSEEKVVNIPLGLELTPFLSPPDRGAARDTLAVPHDVGLVVIVARLVPVKDVGLFLRALAGVRSPLMALVVGDGEDRPALERQAAELGLGTRCRFVGWQRDVRAIYAAADVVALTSKNEGSPVSIIEAMATGSAVVCTAVGGVPDVVKNDESGVLVPHGDVAAISRAIDALLLDPARRQRLGERARDAVYPSYDVSRLLTDMSGLYRAIVSRSEPRIVGREGRGSVG